MSDEPDYLFDAQGPPDQGVVRLERALGTLRHRPPSRVPRAALALAAAAVLAVGLAWWAGRGPDPWATRTAGCDGCVWAEGALLDASIDAEALLALRGTVDVRAGSRVRRLASPDGARLALEAGEIAVRVDAPPRWLVVDLPGVRLVDLGCAYTARVDAAGHGWVSVDTGQVALEGSSTSRLPAGTLAATWPDGRVGLPVARGADDALVAAVDGLSRGSASASDVLAAARRPEDAVTVWNLLSRVDPSGRVAVLDALDALVPGEIRDRDAVLALDPSALDASFAYLVGATL